jgi:hypothetical protein
LSNVQTLQREMPAEAKGYGTRRARRKDLPRQQEPQPLWLHITPMNCLSSSLNGTCWTLPPRKKPR